MNELLKRVLHHIQGEEVTQHEKWLLNEDKPRKVTVKVKTCGMERWIRRVHERQVLTAFDAIALINLAVVDYFDFPSDEQEQALVEGWALELIKSAQAKEVTARDPFTFLPFEGDLESLVWGFSMAEADSFITARGMRWTFKEVAQHYYNEEFGTPANQLLKADDTQAAAEPSQTQTEAKAEPLLVTLTEQLVDDEIASWFDGVSYQQLAGLFKEHVDPTQNEEVWRSYANEARNNGLKAAKVSRGKFNPYIAGHWWLDRKNPTGGWTPARVNRTLANNLPARSLEHKPRLTGDDYK